MITIINKQQDILNTNYWKTPAARKGFVFLSWNAGAGRLLVPKECATILEEIQKVETYLFSNVVVNKKDCLRILCEDFTDTPFCIIVDQRQSDRNVSQLGKFDFSVWTEDGLFKKAKANFVLE